MALTTNKREKIVKTLLICGILSSLIYIGTDILAATLWKGYSYTSQQVSELGAIGAPTRPLWIAMSIVWTLLVVAFSIGVWQSAGPKRSLRVSGILLAAFGVIGILWALFAPMNPRGTAGLKADAMHIVFAGMQVLAMVLFIAFGSGARGKSFRIYSIATIVATLSFGVVPSMKASAIAAGQATPWLGAIERASVYTPIIWVLVLAIVLIRARGQDIVRSEAE